MVAIPVTVFVSDAGGAQAQSVGGSFAPGTPVSSTTINAGLTSIGNIADGGNGNLLLAQPVTLSQDGVIQSLSFYVRVIGGQLRLGLYADNNGSPSGKIAETNAFTPLTGWNIQPVITQTKCAAGNYWIAYLPSSNNLGFFNINNSVGLVRVSFSFGTLPAAFPKPTGRDASWFSFYATFLVSTPGTDGVWTNSNPNPPSPSTGLQVLLSKTSLSGLGAQNAGAVIGAITIANGIQTTPVVIGGADAAKFAITNGGMVPCNLIAARDIPAGSYSITLTAT